MPGASATRARRKTKSASKPARAPRARGSARPEPAADPAPRAPRKNKPLPTKIRVAPPPVDLEVDPAVLEFIAAIDAYRIAHGRPFPTWSEVLHVIRQLGYRKG